MLKKFLLIALASLSIFSTSGCAVAPPDSEVCVELDPDKAWCRFSLSGKEFYVDDAHPYSFSGDPKDKMTWWEQRNLMLLMPYGTWVKVKKFILEICKQTNQCSGEAVSWDRTVERVDQKLDQKLP